MSDAGELMGGEVSESQAEGQVSDEEVLRRATMLLMRLEPDHSASRHVEDSRRAIALSDDEWNARLASGSE